MEERKQRVFNKRVIGKIFGPKREEVIGDWRILHTEGYYDLNA